MQELLSFSSPKDSFKAAFQRGDTFKIRQRKVGKKTLSRSESWRSNGSSNSHAAHVRALQIAPLAETDKAAPPTGPPSNLASETIDDQQYLNRELLSPKFQEETNESTGTNGLHKSTPKSQPHGQFQVFSRLWTGSAGKVVPVSEPSSPIVAARNNEA